MSTYKRGGRYYYDFMIRRVRYRAAIPEARNKAQADRAEVQAQEAVYQNKYGRAGAAITFKQFYEQTYLPWAKLHKRSWRDDELRLQPAVAEFGKLKLAEIAPFRVEQWKRKRIDTPAKRGRGPRALPKPRSAGTVNHELATLSRVFSLAVEQGLLDKNPMAKVKQLPHDGRRKRVCTLAEEQQLRAALPPCLLPIFIIAINTGMRHGEIVALEWPDIDLTRELITIRRSKTGAGRAVPMNAAVRAELTRLHSEREDDVTVFRSNVGRKYERPNVVFRSYCQKLEIDDLHFHDLRHTAATRMGEAGTDLATLMEILGHSNPKTTMIYTHATEAAKRRAVEAISGTQEKDCRKIVAMSARRKA